MSIFQLLLIGGFIMIAFIYLFMLRFHIIDKLVVVIIFFTGIVFILFPDFSTRIANLIGVGRGADLILYLFVIGFLFVFLIFYSKIKSLEKKITKLVRKHAIDEANKNVAV